MKGPHERQSPITDIARLRDPSKTENARERRTSLILHDNLLYRVGLADNVLPNIALAFGGLASIRIRVRLHAMAHSTK